MKKYILPIVAFAVFLIGCKQREEMPTTGQDLFNTLKRVQPKGVLFGHQDDLAYGMHWRYKDGESDVKRVTGDYPAMFGWELGGLERGDRFSLDSVPFDKMKELSIKAHEMGGVNTFSWHPYSLVNGENSWNTDTCVVKYIIPGAPLHAQYRQQLDNIASFFSELKDAQNQPIPFIFRPWHEMGGNWFWWGTGLTTPEEYKALFRFTIDYLKNEKGLTNMLICYSPNGGFQNEQDYLTWYPGDDVVDIFGLDDYEWPGTVNWVEQLQKSLKIVVKVAQEKHKLAALSETGSENLPDSLWFTQKLGKAIASDSISQNLSYVMVWRNDPKVHHFFSYEGSPSAVDAKEFLNHPDMWLLQDFKREKYNK